MSRTGGLLNRLARSGRWLAFSIGSRLRGLSIPLVVSSGAADCGPACVTMVLASLGRRRSLPEVRQRGARSASMSMAELVALAQAWDLKAKGVRLSGDRLDRLPWPAILHWNDNHFVVLESLGANQARLVDPAIGAYDVSIETLLAKSDKAIVFERQGRRGRGARAPVDGLLALYAGLQGLAIVALAPIVGAISAMRAPDPTALAGLVGALLLWGMAAHAGRRRCTSLVRERASQEAGALLSALPFSFHSTAAEVDAMMRRLLFLGPIAIAAGRAEAVRTWRDLTILLVASALTLSHGAFFLAWGGALGLGASLSLFSPPPHRDRSQNQAPQLDQRLQRLGARASMLWTLRGDAARLKAWTSDRQVCPPSGAPEAARGAMGPGPLVVAAAVAAAAVATRGQAPFWALAILLVLVTTATRTLTQAPAERSPPLVAEPSCDALEAHDGGDIVLVAQDAPIRIPIERDALMVLGGGTSSSLAAAARTLVGAARDERWRVLVDGVEPPMGFHGPGLYHAHKADPLYPGGLVENITLFDPQPDLERARALIAALDLKESVMVSLVMVRGAALSDLLARLMLARGLYLGRTLLFVDGLVDQMDSDRRLAAISLIHQASGTRLICSELGQDEWGAKPRGYTIESRNEWLRGNQRWC